MNGFHGNLLDKYINAQPVANWQIEVDPQRIYPAVPSL